MKYIRANDEIFEVKLLFPPHLSYLTIAPYETRFYEKDIEAKANTIEELCDEFVIIWKDKHQLPENFDLLDWSDGEKEKYLDTKMKYDVDTIYGAIWTGRGLKYVAKYNESGKLELYSERPAFY